MTKAKEWSARVAAWRASGQSAEEYCRGRGYSPRTLHWWSSRLRRRPVASDADSHVRMARVVRKSEGASGVAPVVIELSGARVIVQGEASAAMVRAVIEALRAGDRA